jgi:hypothetical protein
MYNLFNFVLLFSMNTVLFGAKFQSQTVDEYLLKAIWIEKFTHFISWPRDINPDTSLFIITVFNPDPFEGKLESIYAGTKIQDRPVKIVQVNSIEVIQPTHILFITKVTDSELDNILFRMKNQPVLIVSNVKDYAFRGTHINFTLVNNALRIEINETALKDSGLFASFRLLNIAKIVHPLTK